MAIRIRILEETGGHCNNMVTPAAASIPPELEPDLLNISVSLWLEKLSDDERDIYNERTAIMEYDGGLKREQAEVEALKMITTNKRYPDRNPYSIFDPPVVAEEATGPLPVKATKSSLASLTGREADALNCQGQRQEEQLREEDEWCRDVCMLYGRQILNCERSKTCRKKSG